MPNPPLKAQYWQELKNAVALGVPVPLTKAYVSYKEAELKALVDEYLGDSQAEADDVSESFDASRAAAESLVAASFGSPTPTPDALSQSLAQPGPGASSPLGAGGAAQSGAQAATEDLRPPVSEWGRYAPETLARLLGVPFSDLPSRRAGLTFNTHGPDDPLRVDSQGKVWYRDEVPKPAIPLPRMRRKVKYVNPGVKTVERRLPDGHLDESFEVAGDGHEEAEIKITLPSSQVGIYYDPRLPFRVHVYNGRRGFDYMDIIRFYGGDLLVPEDIKKATLYVDGDLCFDIIKTRTIMERELREARLGRN
ncbi:hypothetical protein SEA_MORRILL_45 [Microbacterium phage Morrill]|nr:hypothetical protein SEA_MORRILL_45 [Microbacterium phage Morrill]